MGWNSKLEKSGSHIEWLHGIQYNDTQYSNLQLGSMITNGREPRSCFGGVFNFKSGSFTDSTKIVQPANSHF
jgi:hypothetical protein